MHSSLSEAGSIGSPVSGLMCHYPMRVLSLLHHYVRAVFDAACKFGGEDLVNPFRPIGTVDL